MEHEISLKVAGNRNIFDFSLVIFYWSIFVIFYWIDRVINCVTHGQGPAFDPFYLFSTSSPPYHHTKAQAAASLLCSFSVK